MKRATKCSNYCTRNCFNLISKIKLVQELTFWENWKKVAKPI